MSWSHQMSGPPMEIAVKLERQGEMVQKYLRSTAASYPSQRAEFDAETALHARVVGLCVVACLESKEHDIRITANGHYDGKHQHVTVQIDGIDKPPAAEPMTPVEPSSSYTEDPTPQAQPESACRKCKPGKPCAKHKTA